MKRNRTRLLTLCGVILVLAVFISLLIAPNNLEVPFALTFGWIQFLRRTVPQIEWNWDLVGMAVVCSALILVLGHRLASWLTHAVASKLGMRWRWRWTVSGFAAVALSFLVGMSVGGAAHQIGWLSGQNESWFERKGGQFAELRQFELGLYLAADDGNRDPIALRHAVLSNKNFYLPDRPGEPPLLEKFHVLLVLDDQGRIAGAIVFHRDPSRQEKAGGIYRLNEHFERFAPGDLPELIRKHEGRLLKL